MKFCSNCGEKLNADARFCVSCGKAAHAQEYKGANKNVGKINKCDNCGATLDSVSTHCPWCGCEFKSVESLNSIKEFTWQLSLIESERLEIDTSQKSVKEMLFGSDAKKKAAQAEAEAAFEKRKIEKKASYIINYPIPNLKEDLLEFMLLISTNISANDSKAGLLKAWDTKLEQVYKKAKLIVNNETDLLEIEQIYHKSKKKSTEKDLLCQPYLSGFI